MKYIYVSVAMICSVSENGAFLLLASVAKLETNTFPICREVEFDTYNWGPEWLEG